MTRATPMPPEERRASIIEATLPLLLQHGPSLTTKQVAEAAGVAEGTIFRVFDSLADLIEATTLEALSAQRLEQSLTAVDAPTSLTEFTESALTLLTHRMLDIRTLLHAVHHSPRKKDGQCMRGELENRRTELHNWLLERVEPFVAELRIPPSTYLELLRTLALGRVFSHDDNALTPHDLASLALQGAGKAS